MADNQSQKRCTMDSLKEKDNPAPNPCLLYTSLKAQDLSGKKVALFGCGDSGSYPDTFCDAFGLIYDGLQQSGCTFVGAYAPEGYDETCLLYTSPAPGTG